MNGNIPLEQHRLLSGNSSFIIPKILNVALSRPCPDLKLIISCNLYESNISIDKYEESISIKTQ